MEILRDIIYRFQKVIMKYERNGKIYYNFNIQFKN